MPSNQRGFGILDQDTTTDCRFILIPKHPSFPLQCVIPKAQSTASSNLIASYLQQPLGGTVKQWGTDTKVYEVQTIHFTFHKFNEIGAIQCKVWKKHG